MEGSNRKKFLKLSDGFFVFTVLFFCAFIYSLYDRQIGGDSNWYTVASVGFDVSALGMFITTIIWRRLKN